ncbi:cysteine-rich venom protein-like [Diadema antillarum]|uniref:cysteine-rich venom protein-like n=1 Tax=Diadema antillarum TaxID=105358 RepID=UPI003A879BBD
MHHARFIIALCICMGVLASAEVDPALHGHRSKRSPTPFSAEERMGILDLHNQLRSGVSPEASNMRYMVWDDSLATMAQQWSDGCVYEHGNPTNISPFDPVGQNLWAGTFYDDGTHATQSWYDEVTDYNYESNQCSAVCGHYTQVVWAESYAVGCGRTFCANLVGFTQNAYMITCNYGPAGNVVGQRPYLTGLSCSECSTGSGQCFNNQCRPCSEHSEPCECRYTCENCGILNSDCTCTCQNGYRDNRTANYISDYDHESTNTCTHDHESTNTCKNHHESANTCTHDHESTNTCKNHHESANTCSNHHESTNTSSHHHESTNTCSHHHACVNSQTYHHKFHHVYPGIFASDNSFTSPHNHEDYHTRSYQRINHHYHDCDNPAH